MIFDLTLQENAYVLQVHKKFFQNKSFSLSLFQGENDLTKRYSRLGKFEIEGRSFGFNKCFKKLREEGDYIIYEFAFPKPSKSIMTGSFISTIHLLTHYVLTQMYDEQEFFNEGLWDDQSVACDTWDSYSLRGRMHHFSIDGILYPWFKENLYELNDDSLSELNNYVLSELKRVYYHFWNKELFFSQVDITRESFFIHVAMSGRWISWVKKKDLSQSEEFDSHNIDFSSDQELCLVAIIAMNTWLRKNS